MSETPPLPRGWAELIAFLHSPDVLPPFGPFLDVALRMWECGYQRKTPPELVPFAELLQVRKLDGYERIMRAEEQVGKYAKRSRRESDAEPETRQRSATVFRLKHVAPKKSKGGGVVFEREGNDDDKK